MSIFSAAGCLLNRHQPIRREVTWNGRCYVGECRHCGEPIERLGRRDWRKRKVADERREGAPTPT